MNITLPLPPTTNATYKVGNGHMYKSEKAQQWFDDAFAEIKKDVKHDRFGTENVYVEITLWLKRDRDIDGGIKPVLDVLQTAHVYENDSQVLFLEVRKEKIEKGEKIKEGMDICVY
jgi:Holliday junction resolvase RusA-like endonuclease